MFSKAFIAAALCALAPTAFAGFSQGNVNLTRDYAIKYSTKTYGNTEAFCKKFREECVDYAGPKGYHHQLDCVFNQPAPEVYAFCGGIKKSASGDWADGDEPIVPFTQKMIHMVPGASIAAGPIGKSACLKAKKTHKHIVC